MAVPTSGPSATISKPRNDRRSAEINNWRSQKILLKPQAMKTNSQAPQKAQNTSTMNKLMSRTIVAGVAAAILAVGGSSWLNQEFRNSLIPPLIF